MPIAKALKRGAKLALLMLLGAAAGLILDIGGVLHPLRTTNNGVARAEADVVSAMVGAGGGLVFYLLLPIIGPRFAALNARMQADTWRTPKTGG
jgi:hypothetical protein